MHGTEDSDLRLDLERALARLTPKQRRALQLWYQGYTLEEIAVQAGVTKMAICYRIKAAIATIRGRLL